MPINTYISNYNRLLIKLVIVVFIVRKELTANCSSNCVLQVWLSQGLFSFVNAILKFATPMDVSPHVMNSSRAS